MLGANKSSVAVLAITAFCLSTTSAKVRPSGDVCFYSLETASSDRTRCKADPLGVAQMAEIKTAISRLGLNEVKLAFEGCVSASFATLASGPDASRRKFVIYYPAGEANSESLLIPILHELGHVYQLKTHGSAAELLDAFSMLQVELGADFLTGFLSGHELNLKPVLFQENLEVVGRYRGFSLASHGTPEQRMKAFRLGYFRNTAEHSANLDQNYASFNDHIFHEIHEEQ